ncbi:MAG: molybdopterin synthase [Halobacteriota archaeon]
MKVVCVVGESDSGKTSLVERLVPALDGRGRVATVKAIHHDVEVDEEGKDTYRHREAGAERVVGVTPSTRFEFLDHDGGGGKEEEIRRALDELADAGFDYVLVEGFSGSSLPKLSVEEARPDVENVLLEGAGEKSTDALVDAVEDVDEHETLASLIQQAKDGPRSPEAGAVATFTGRVREHNVEDGRTSHLEYEKYEDVADQRMAEISDDLEARDGVFEVAMHHETGVVPAGEDAVHVVVLAGHRREAFRAVEDAIDRLKDEVPIFKKEVTESGEFWTHERP